MMRGNPVRVNLRKGGTAIGHMAFEFFTPSLPQIVKAAGAQFLLYDMEHSGIGVETMKAQFAACRGLDLVPLVRVPATEYHFVARMLDAGAMGIMVPMVETAEQAARIVSYTRYPPHGRRGAAFGVAPHDDYLGGDVTETMAAAHDFGNEQKPGAVMAASFLTLTRCWVITNQHVSLPPRPSPAFRDTPGRRRRAGPGQGQR